MMSIALAVLIVGVSMALGLIVVSWLDWKHSRRRGVPCEDLRRSIRNAERAERDRNSHLGAKEKT